MSSQHFYGSLVMLGSTKVPTAAVKPTTPLPPGWDGVSFLQVPSRVEPNSVPLNIDFESEIDSELDN
jgi:hypothetical protein